MYLVYGCPPRITPGEDFRAALESFGNLSWNIEELNNSTMFIDLKVQIQNNIT